MNTEVWSWAAVIVCKQVTHAQLSVSLVDLMSSKQLVWRKKCSMF